MKSVQDSAYVPANAVDVSHADYLGSVPEKYDRYLGPLLFEPYAADLADRLAALQPSRVLEIACGTGIVTRRMRDALPGGAEILASDLNAAMIGVATRKFQAGENVAFAVADATRLPMTAATFDAVICQFGVMFFSDKVAAFAECARVLRPGGHLLFSVWDSLQHNELPRLADEAARAHFPDDPPTFFSTPFGYHDKPLIAESLAQAGLQLIAVVELTKPSESPAAMDAAMGFIEGTPVSGEISQRDPRALELVRDALSLRYQERFGMGPVRAPMRAVIFDAAKP